MTKHTVKYDFSYEQDDLPVRGNAMVSGDDVADKACEDEILERLERGDATAWACITITASLKVKDRTYKGTANLGACTGNNEKDLRLQASDYGLEAEALADLKANMRDVVASGEIAADALKELGDA